MAKALIHILGSHTGYTTLDATAGVAAGERAELEVLSFGDATNAEVMSRLESDASMIGRRLRSGRFAISRMLPGGTDDAGRPTIEVVTLVLEQSAYETVVGALDSLAADARVWRLARAAVPRGYELPERNPSGVAHDPAVLRAFDAWTTGRQRGAIAVLPDGEEPALLAMVSLLDRTDLSECRWGIGVLSLSAPVDVCTLAPTTAPFGPRPILRATAGSTWLAPGMAEVARQAVEQPFLPPSRAASHAVRIEPALGGQARSVAVEEAADDATHGPERDGSARLTKVAALAAVASLLLLLVMVMLYRASGRGRGVIAATPTQQQGNGETPPADGAGPASGDGGAADLDTVPRSGGSGYDSIATIPPATPVVLDSDGDGVADDADECPYQSGFVLQEFYLDADLDGIGAGDPRRICVLPGAIRAEEGGQVFVNASGDACPEDPSLHEMREFFLDLDGDGLGAGTAELFCSTKRIFESEGRLFVVEGGDECPDNPARTSGGACGCDWPYRDEDADGDGTMDCLEDDDGDGRANKDDDDGDRRKTTLDEIVREPLGLPAAKEELLAAQVALEALEQEIVSAEKVRSPEDRKQELVALQRKLIAPQANIEAALRIVYEARLKANFGSCGFQAPKVDGLAAPNIMAVATVADFEILFEVMGLAKRLSSRFIRCENRVVRGTGFNSGIWSDQIDKMWAESVLGDSYRKKVGEWVLGFMRMKEDAIEKEIQKERNAIEREIARESRRANGQNRGTP